MRHDITILKKTKVPVSACNKNFQHPSPKLRGDRTSKLVTSRLSKISISILMLCLLVGQILAQQEHIGNAFTNPAVAPGAPAGSYAVSNIESVSLSSGDLNVSLPLLQIGGRGTAGYTMMLPLEYKWTIKHLYYPNGGGQDSPWVHHYFPVDNWTGNAPDHLRYCPGAMRMQRASDVNANCGIDPVNITGKVLTRMIFMGPDGSQIELFDDRTKGKPAYFAACFDIPDAAFRGHIWRSSGSDVTFFSDAVYTETIAPADDVERLPSGMLLFPNGNRYRVDLGRVSYIIDRNGNKVSFVYGGAPGGDVDNLASITDSLGRVVTISYGTTNTSPDVIRFKGTNDATRTIEVGRNLLGNILRVGQTLKSTLDLFPGLPGFLSKIV